MGNHQNHLGSFKNTGSCPPFQAQGKNLQERTQRSTSLSSLLPDSSDGQQGLGVISPFLPRLAPYFPPGFLTPAFTRSEKYTCLRKRLEPLQEQRAANVFQNKELSIFIIISRPIFRPWLTRPLELQINTYFVPCLNRCSNIGDTRFIQAGRQLPQLSESILPFHSSQEEKLIILS